MPISQGLWGRGEGGRIAMERGEVRMSERRLGLMMMTMIDDDK